MNIKIQNDVYNIANRIKEIDRNYFIVYNTSKRNFEIHSLSQIGNSYCLTLPYKELDARALQHVQTTKTKNIDKILNQIEAENKLKENADKRGVLSQFSSALEDEIKRR